MKKVQYIRNGGRWTECDYWQHIRSALRSFSAQRRTYFKWKVIEDCKENAKRPYVGDNRRRRVEYVCSVCKVGFQKKEVNVDHIIPVGSLNKPEDLPGFVERLFCELENLRVVCIPCHKIITKETIDE